jgi:glycosyltransferase involved in cell wall biosynthesis
VLSNPSVTVLVPSYNHGIYLRERIESIYAQTYQSFELYVIDDCSQDNSDQVISQLQSEYGFTYIRNELNSGTPFASWERICTLAKGKYIWVCESDDVAEPSFLEIAIGRMEANPKAVLFYANSDVIDEDSKVIGNTESYFQDVWKEKRWKKDFSANGINEFLGFQLRGQIVPNMSSALIATTAFRGAFSPFLKQLRLTGDWLFIGDVIRQGDIEFSSMRLSRFRKHEVTSRVRVKSAQSQAEFILTKYRLFRVSGLALSEFAPLMASDVVRFLYEPAKWWEVVSALVKISFSNTISCCLIMIFSIINNPKNLKKFMQRYSHARIWRKEND